MKTAEGILENRLIGYYWGNNLDDVPADKVISCMKEYAKQVSEQALKDAAENATLIYDRTSNYKAMSIDKQSILKTEIKLP